MRFRHALILSVFFVIACKTASVDAPRPAAPVPAPARQAEETAAVAPSPALLSTPNLLTPGNDEVLIRRGPGARCPSPFELDEIKNAVQTLGQDTMNLVGEDLNSLERTRTRTDHDGISSCCNQLEQLAQDVEVLNEDKASAAPYLQKIRGLAIQLCSVAD